MRPIYYIARFRGVRGRYLVEDEGGCYGGQKICASPKRQQSYGNQPHYPTGLYLNEMYRTFGKSEVESLKRFEGSKS